MTAPIPGQNKAPVKPPKSTPSSSTSGNVRVVSRVRPMAQYEVDNGSKSVVTKVPHIMEDNNNGPETLQISNGPGNDPRWFELDAVLDQSCSQQEVYENSGAFEAISEDLFSGYNCTILAYGQTGAGKTFTMGTAAKNVAHIDENDGVIPRAVKDLFDNIQSKCDSNAHVELSYLEVYNEEIRDLMNPSNNTTQSQLRIRETMEGEVYVRGLQAVTVGNPTEIGKLMEEASKRRVVASTKMNATSSRSHAICVLKIKGVLEDSTKFQSKLTLVDLAGSERIKKTEAKGSRAQEGININKGLFVLGQVVSALAEQRPKFQRKPPFRDSKLTRLLQDSLGGNSRTIMIACCSPADFNLEETINTLRYATQARNIKNTATANVVQQISQEEAMKLRRDNQLLKKQVEELEETIRQLTDDVTEEDLNRSVAMIEEVIKKSSSGRTMVSPLAEPPATIPSSAKHHLPPTPEMEIPPPQDDADDNEGASSMDEDGDEPRPLANTSPRFQQDRNRPGKGGRHNGPPSLDGFFSSQQETGLSIPNPHEDDTTSLALSEVLPGLRNYHPTDRSVASHNSTKSYHELEEENAMLHYKLKQTQLDMKASMTQSAIELPALRARVEMLEDELNNSAVFEQEAEELRRELDEANADRKSALLAAKQLSQFMEKQKSQYGFRGDEMEKKRLWYFHKRLDEKWVEFVVAMLASFKEQMRLLGDYFDMVVTVVESPDILTMLGPQGGGRKKQGPWWGGAFGQKNNAGDDKNSSAAGKEEKELRHRLLTEHIKFFNCRLVEIEDEITNRSESVDAILEGLSFERSALEGELSETEVFHDIFSKKGERLLKHLTELMTGPLYSMEGFDKHNLGSSSNRAPVAALKGNDNDLGLDATEL